MIPLRPRSQCWRRYAPTGFSYTKRPLTHAQEYHGYDDSPQQSNDSWDDEFTADERDLRHDSDSHSHESDATHLDEFSGVSRLELAKQRRKERIRRQRLEGKRSRYGRKAAEHESVQEDHERYHSRYENEYNDSRFGGSSSSRWDDDFGNEDESEGPTFTRSF